MAKHITITVSAAQYVDEDDCLAAAERDAAEEYDCAGYDMAARWADEDRTEIALDVPAHAAAKRATR